MPTQIINTDQGTTERKFTNQSFDVYDCTGGIFHANKPEPNYPFHVEGGPTDVEMFGGVTLGALDPATPRDKVPGGLYENFNSAAVFGQNGTNAPNFHIHDWVFGSPTADAHVWDAMRFKGNSVNHVVDHVVIWGCRDDAIEIDNNTGGSVSISDCLWHDCYAGVSATDNNTGRTINITRLLLKVTDRFPGASETDFHSGPLFKVGGGTCPAFVVNDSVFAYEGEPQELARLTTAFANWTGTGNTLCFMVSPYTGLGGTMPAGFPTVPAGMTVLEGTAAQAFWDAAVNDYLGAGAPWGVDYYTTIPETAVSMVYSLPAPPGTAPETDSITIDVVVERAVDPVATRPVSINSNASMGYVRITMNGAVQFAMFDNALTKIFTCQTVDDVIAAGTKARVRVVADRTSGTAGDVNCWIDTDGTGLVNVDGGTPAANLPFGTGVAWDTANIFGYTTNRRWHIGQSNFTDDGKVGRVIVYQGQSYNDALEYDPLTLSSLYVRANAAETGFEKWNGSTWDAI